MRKLISIIIYTAIVFFGSNFILFSLNTTNYLFFNEIVIANNKFLNIIFLFILFIILEAILLIIFNRFFSLLDKNRYYFILSLIFTIIFIFINKILMNNSKFNDLNNILSIILTIFLTTYTFYYSIYYFTLLKYKRNV